MKKKMILTFGMALLFTAPCLAGCQKAAEEPKPVTPSTEKKTDNSQKPLPSQKKRRNPGKASPQKFDRANPEQRVDSLEAISQYAKGAKVFPEALPGGYTFNSGWKIEGKAGKAVYQLVYQKNRKTVALRFSPNVEDPQLSGDQRRHRWKKNTIIAGKDVAVAGERGRVYKCLWREKDLNLSLTSRIAMAPDEAKGIIQAV